LTEYSQDKKQSERGKKNEEMLRKLIAHFPGRVFGRLVDLCNPTTPKYRLAISTVLGKKYFLHTRVLNC